MKLDTLVVVLAGGEGSRLWPLTEKRTKPAVTIGGKFRLIDIPISNAFNSGLRQALVLVQGKDKSLNRSIKNNWNSDPKTKTFVEVISPQQTRGEYGGDADAVRQIKEDILYFDPNTVLIVPGDHLLKMRYDIFTEYLKKHDADAVISYIPKPLAYTKDLGAVKVNGENRIIKFAEKDSNTPLRNQDNPELFNASMGIYAFKTESLIEAIDLKGTGFGKDIIPQLIGSMKILGYDYSKFNIIPDIIRIEKDGYMEETEVENSPDADYWKDVGTLKEYLEANMDLVSIRPKFNLYGKWRFFTSVYGLGQAKFDNVTKATAGEGAILSNVSGENYVISPEVYIDKSNLERVIVFNRSDIQKCNLKNTIVDKQTKLRSVEIGFDEQADLERKIYIDHASGIRVVPKFYDSTKPETWRDLQKK